MKPEKVFICCATELQLADMFISPPAAVTVSLLVWS